MNNNYLDIFYAIVESVDPIPKNDGGPLDFIIFIKKVGTEGDYVGSIPMRANPPSILPFSITGGGSNAKPVPGTYCWAVRDTSSADKRAQILTYAPHPGINPQGLFNNEYTPDGSLIIKIGGIQKSVLRMTTNGELSLYSDVFSELHIYGDESRINLITKRHSLFYEGGLAKYDYFTDHSSGINNLTSFWQSYAISSEVRLGSDREIVETEQITPEMITYGGTAPYVNKTIIRAGQIFNQAHVGSDSILGHIYQIETRQGILSNYKDTVSVLKLGYQKEQKNFSTDKISSAGTLYSWTAKQNDSTPGNGKYSSYVLRYGKLESNDDDKSQGEIFRNQIYSDVVDTIGTPIVDTVGESKGYDFKYNNIGATQQYLESFGKLVNPEDSYLQNSYWRFHIHSFDNHTLTNKSNYSGYVYNEYFGGKTSDNKDSYFNKKFNHKSSGNDKIIFETSFIFNDGGTYSLSRYEKISADNYAKLSFSNKEYILEHNDIMNKSNEKINMSKDLMELFVTPDGTFIYDIKMNNKKMIFNVNNGSKKTEVIIESNQITVNAPDNVNINTKTANIKATTSTNVTSPKIIVEGDSVEFKGNKVTIDKIIDGVTAGFCKLPLCAVTGAPHTIKSVP